MDQAIALDSKMARSKKIALTELKPYQKATVTDIGIKGPQRRRLIDMGITPGAKLMMRKVAPLGDPVEIFIRGYELSLRKHDASQVFVEID